MAQIPHDYVFDNGPMKDTDSEWLIPFSFSSVFSFRRLCSLSSLPIRYLGKPEVLSGIQKLF